MQYGMKWHDMVIIIKIFGTTFAFFLLVGIFGGIFHLRLWWCSYGLWIVDSQDTDDGKKKGYKIKTKYTHEM